MVERLDEMDGDPDVELNGDELDGTAAKDDFYPHSGWRGEPGCEFRAFMRGRFKTGG